MKTKSSSATARVLLVTPFLIISLFLFALAFSNMIAANSARSTKGKASPDAIVPTTFSGTFDPHVFPCATSRHHFMVPAGQGRITVHVDAVVPINDITITLLFGPDPVPVPLQTEDTGVGSEVLTYAPGGLLPPGEYQVQICQAGNAVMPTPPFDYNGVFAYDDNLIGGTAPPPTGPLTAAPQDTGAKVGYENFEPPGEITPVVVTSSGGLTVEYLGRYAIEPSIGANWNTGIITYQSDLQTLFVTFDDSCSLMNPKATWVNRPANISILVDSDPILFTDRVTNRTFVSTLTLLSPDTAKNAYTDNDGQSWTPTQTGGIASAVDHQTIGGGKYHLINGVEPPHSPTYANAVYYCSQDIAFASCARSDDGGLTYGAAIPMYALTACGGLHGHLKVSPVDGTVYIPNRSCGGVQSIVLSEDNGITWQVRTVNTATQSAAPSVVGGGDDPSVSVDNAGNVYFAFSNFGTQPGVAVSSDKGLTWSKMYDIGAPTTLNNVCFPAATAGDAGRAAVTFYGSVTPNGGTHGNSNDGTFDGVWHLFVAHTFDTGTTWTTTDITPVMPMQRSGLLRGGGADAWRNLADFYDLTTDKDGRVLVGYNNGCAGGNCAQAPVNPDGTSPVKGNAYSSTASIARQSSGRRMLAAHDPAPGSMSAPGMPFVTQLRKGDHVALMWNQADTGNSTITGYQILRSTSPGTETLLATVPGTQNGGSYLDATATDRNATYYYKVVAQNGVGSSCPNNEIDAPYVGETCTGLIIHRNDPSHPESTGGGSAGQPPIPQLLIDYVAVGEQAGTDNLIFKMKMVDLTTLPPNSRWRISWDWYNPTLDTQLYYIGMKTDENSAVSFEYGTLADAGVPAVLVLGETMRGTLLPATNYSSDGTITMYVPRSAVGNPQPGDLLGAIAGKTITGDTPQTNTLQRSTTFVDHTFIKGTTDTAYPAATYTIVGNTTCPSGVIVPVGASSRKTHGSAGDWDIDLPFTGSPGIECRKGQGANSNNHKVVVTFASPVSVNGNPQATVTGSGQVSGVNVNGSVVTIDLTNVANAQTVNVTLLSVTDGTNSGDVNIPMAVLLGDTNANRSVNSSDISQTKSQSGAAFGASNFREDVTVNGSINSSDIAIVKAQSGSALP